MRIIATIVTTLALASCATPYQEMGFTGGVQATQITADTAQIRAQGNAYTDADTIQRYALRKAAETTLAAGYDLFYIMGSQDRSTTGYQTFANATAYGNSAYGSSYGQAFIKPGQSVMIQMVRGPKPNPTPPGLFDARELLKYLVPPTTK